MKKRILIVDDEAEFTHMLKYSLESVGYYEVAEENDAGRAPATAREFDPDVVVLDVMMPDLDGSEVAARMKADRALAEVPVIFLTALVTDDDAPGGACSRGGQTFLSKSVRISQLVECIEAKTERRAGVAAVAGAR
jgi:DNA-binding response OmpR family regulator